MSGAETYVAVGVRPSVVAVRVEDTRVRAVVPVGTAVEAAPHATQRQPTMRTIPYVSLSGC